MRGLHIADIHLSGKRLAVIERCFEQIREHGPYDYCIIAGDVFDQAQIGDRNASTGSLLTSLMGNLDNLDCPCFIIAGQHDLSPLGRSAIAPLIDMRTITIPTMEKHGDILLLCMPWVYPDNILAASERKDISADELARRYRKAVNDVLKGFAVEAAEHDGPVIFVGHLQVIGAGLPSGIGLEESARNLCVTREQLLAVGADYYALGDIHKRQELALGKGGYVGVLAQMNFGEGACIGVPDRNDREGCAAGFEIVEWEGKKVVSVEFVEADAPKYFTIGSEQTYWHQTNFLADPGEKVVRIRDYEMPEIGVPIPEGYTFERIPQLAETRVRADDMTVDKPLADLMRQWGGVVGAEITDGAVALAEELQPQGEHAAAMGSLQKIERIILKHIGPHEDTDIILPDGLIGIAGPNGSGKSFIADAMRIAKDGSSSSRPGTYELVTTGYEDEALVQVEFLSSDEAYVASRKMNAAKAKQDAYLIRPNADEAIAGPKVRDFEAAMDRLVGPTSLLDATIFSSQNSAGDLTEVQPRERQSILRKLIGADRYEGIHEAAKERRNAAAGEITALQRQAEDAATLAATLPDLTLEHDRITAMLAAAEKEVADQETALEDIRLRTAEIEVAQRQRGRLEVETTEAASRVTKAEATLKDMQQRIVDAQLSAGSLDRIEQELAIFVGIEKQVAKVNALLAKEPACRERIHEAEMRVKEADLALSRAKETLVREEAEAALIEDPHLGCDSPTSPPPCKFMEKAAQAKTRLPRLVTERDEAEEKTTWWHDALRGAKEKYAEHEFPQLQEQARQHEAKLKQAAALRERKAGLAATLANLPEMREQADDYERELPHMREQAVEKANLLAAAEQPDISQRDLLAQKSTAERLVQQARINVSKHTQTLGAQSERIEQANAAGRQANELKANIRANEAVLADIELVARAFGKDGIPQLLIDTAIPQIQAILDELLDGSDLKLSLSTTRDNKSGTQRETLDILVHGPDGAREIAACSGGERKKLRIVLRLALAKFQVQRAGNRYEVLIVDEAFDALDADNRQFVLDCLERLSGFRQIIIVTHADDLIAALPSRLYLTKSNGVTAVEVA